MDLLAPSTSIQFQLILCRTGFLKCPYMPIRLIRPVSVGLVCIKLFKCVFLHPQPWKSLLSGKLLYFIIIAIPSLGILTIFSFLL